MKQLLFFLAAVILLLQSCITQKKCLQKFPPATHVTDSIITKDTIIYKDTVITIMPDAVLLHDTINCPDVEYHKQVRSAAGHVAATVDISKGRLTVDCRTDSLQLVIKNLQTTIRTLEKYHGEVKTITAPPLPAQIKYKVPKWCWWLLLVNTVYAGWKFRKPILKQLTHIQS